MSRLTLLGRSLARSAPLLTAVSVLMAGFQIALVLLASSYDRTESFDRLALLAPSFLQRSLGTGLHAVASFSGLIALGYFHPLVTIAVVLTAMYVATDPADDVESGMVDLMLSRSVPRHWLVTRSLVHSVLAALFVVALMECSTAAALFVAAPPAARGPTAALLAELGLYLVALASCSGAVALAAAALARRRATAFAAASLAALTLYLVDVLAPFFRLARLLAWASPFHYAHGWAILTETNAACRDLAVLAGIGAVSAAFAYRAFEQRDL